MFVSFNFEFTSNRRMQYSNWNLNQPKEETKSMTGANNDTQSNESMEHSHVTPQLTAEVELLRSFVKKI